MVIGDCSIGEDEPATVGIATVAPNGASVGEIALGGFNLFGRYVTRGVSKVGSWKNDGWGD